MTAQISAVNLITLDLIYFNISRIPGMGEEIATNSFKIALGGGPTAALATASRLGAQTRLATCLGNDHISGIARKMLEDEGLSFHGFSPRGEGSPVNITSVMTFSGNDRAFLSYFPETDFPAGRTDEIYGYIKDSAYCIASSPDPALFSRLCRDGCRIVYDASWDDNLSIDALKDTLKLVYLFTPNEKEALKLTGAPNPREAMLRLAGYVEHPVIKLGKDGALTLHEGEIIHLPAGDFVPVDSTGAGDAFLGGVTYGLLSGWTLPRSVELGNYTGAKATTAVGCLTARPSLEEFKKLCP